MFFDAGTAEHVDADRPKVKVGATAKGFDAGRPEVLDGAIAETEVNVAGFAGITEATADGADELSGVAAHTHRTSLRRALMTHLLAGSRRLPRRKRAWRLQLLARPKVGCR